MWTYSGDPSDSEKNAVRFLLQDTNESRPLVQDEEIDWLITQNANLYLAAAALCDVLVAKTGAMRSKTIGEFRISYSSDFYKMLGASLRARGLTHQLPYAGGISIADKLNQQNSSDWVDPAVSRGLGDNPAAPHPTTPSQNPLTTI